MIYALFCFYRSMHFLESARASRVAVSSSRKAKGRDKLIDLALHRAGTYSSLTLKRVQKRISNTEVELTGDEIRMILDLALEAKRAQKRRRPHLRVVPSVGASRES